MISIETIKDLQNLHSAARSLPKDKDYVNSMILLYSTSEREQKSVRIPPNLEKKIVQTLRDYFRTAIEEMNEKAKEELNVS